MSVPWRFTQAMNGGPTCTVDKRYLCLCCRVSVKSQVGGCRWKSDVSVTRSGRFLCSKASIKGLTQINIFVMFAALEYEIRHHSEAVQDEILDLPDTLAARYVVLTRRMVALGPNLGEPHTKAMKNGLFELRLKGAEGIARVFYCKLVGRRIVMLHSFVKKTNRTPARELDTAMTRLKEVKHENP